MLKIGIPLRKESQMLKINLEYIQYIQAQNMIPIFLSLDNFPLLSELCDGFLLPGGYDIHPKYYYEKNSLCKMIDSSMDKIDFKILSYCEKNRIPLLGICRGIQSINVYFKGSLYQDMNLKLFMYHKNTNEHAIQITKNPFLQEGNYIVNSFHHQSIQKLGNGLIAFANSFDYCIEGIYHKKLPILGVQFHPEKMDTPLSKSILDWFQKSILDNKKNKE